MKPNLLSTETTDAFVKLGKIQIDFLFAFNEPLILDDSDFIPLLDNPNQNV